MSSTAFDRSVGGSVAVTTLSVGTALLLRLTAPPLPILVIVLLALAIAASRRPIGVVAAVALSLPWFYQPVQVGTQQFSASELLLVVAGMSTVIHEVTNLVARRSRIASLLARVVGALASPLVVVLSVLTAVGLLLSFFPYDSAHRAESLREWRWTLLEPLAFLVMLILVATRTRDGVMVAGALLVGGGIAAMQAFADLVIGGGVSVAGVTRVAGPYPHPNALALMEARIAAFGIAWWAWSSRKPFWVIVISATATMAVAASLSRGAMLALAIAVVLVLPQLPRRIRYVTTVGGAGAVIALVVVARDRMLDLFGGGSGSLRLDIWRSATEMIAARPFSGYGPDQFLYAYLPRYVEPTAWGERFTAHAHNLVFDFWIRLGIIGLAFTMMVGVVCARLIVRAVRGESGGALRAAAIIALAASLTHGLIDNAYFTHDLAMSGWLLGWLAMGPPAIDSAEGVDNGARPGYGRRWVHRFSSLR